MHECVAIVIDGKLLKTMILKYRMCKSSLHDKVRLDVFMLFSLSYWHAPCYKFHVYRSIWTGLFIATPRKLWDTSKGAHSVISSGGG